MPQRIDGFRNGPYDFEVIDTGPIDGRPIVLLHGFPQRAASWLHVAEILHGNGFRTIAPDQRGYSPGARPRRRRDYRQSELVGDVLALLEVIGTDRIDLVGHDWGASVAWMLAANHPDRVRTLTALSVPHPRAFIAAMGHGQAHRSWYMAAFQVPWFPETFLRAAARHRKDFGARMGLPEPFASRVRTDIVTDDVLPGALGWYRALPIPDPSLPPRPVRVPTTYVWSDGDFALSRSGAMQCSGWVDAPYRFINLPGASHWLPETEPAAVAAAIVDRVRSG